MFFVRLDITSHFGASPVQTCAVSFFVLFCVCVCATKMSASNAETEDHHLLCKRRKLEKLEGKMAALRAGVEARQMPPSRGE